MNQKIQLMIGVMLIIILVIPAIASAEPWWNTSWNYKKQINITNNNLSQVLEQNYTVNVTFNHSQLVQQGKSTANGSDVRILWYDSTPWWNNSWLYRKKITITNKNLSQVLEQNYTVNITLDTTGSKFVAAGNDTRIVWWNGTNNIELDRVNTTAFSAVNTSIWFKLQKNISANSWDDNYYVYYGNPSAGAAPANGSNIYLFYDDFEDGDINGWTTEAGSFTVVNGWVKGGAGDSRMYYPFTFNFSNMQIFWRWNDTRTGSTDGDIVFLSSTWCNSIAYAHIFSQNAVYTDSFGSWNTGCSAFTKIINPGAFSVVATPYVMRITAYNNNFSLYINSVYNNSNVDSSLGSTSRIYLVDSNFAGGSWDYIYVAKYLSPEPSASLGTEQGQSRYVELDRVNTTAFNNAAANTVLWFKTQTNIPAGGSDANYSLYYGNPSAGSPLQNGSNVFVYYDDFSTNTGWTFTAGASGYIAIQNGRLEGNGLVRDSTDRRAYRQLTESLRDFEWTLSTTSSNTGADWQQATTYLKNNSASACDGGVAIGLYHWGSYGNRAPAIYNLPPGCDSPALTLTQRATGSIDYLKIRRSGNNLTMWQYSDANMGTLLNFGSVTTSLSSLSYLTGLANNLVGQPQTWTGWVDDFKLRKYLSPEPSASLGIEECYDCIPPQITISSPLNQTYSTTSVDLNYSVADSNLDWVGYSLNNTANVTLTSDDFNDNSVSSIWIRNSPFATGNVVVAEQNQRLEFSISTGANEKWFYRYSATQNNSVNNVTLIVKYTANPTTDVVNPTVGFWRDSNMYVFAGKAFKATDASYDWQTMWKNTGAGESSCANQNADWGSHVWMKLEISNIDTVTLYTSADKVTWTQRLQCTGTGLQSGKYYPFIGTEWQNTGHAGTITFDDFTFIGSDYSMNLTGLSEGTHNITVYANDTFGNQNSSRVFFTVDTTPPQITIQSPLSQRYSTGSIDYNITANEALGFARVSIDSGPNMSMANDTLYHYYNLSSAHASLGSGHHSAIFFVQDLFGNQNSSSISFMVGNIYVSGYALYSKTGLLMSNANVTAIIRETGVTVNTTTDSQGSFELWIIAALQANKEYNLVIKVFDSQGRESYLIEKFRE